MYLNGNAEEFELRDAILARVTALVRANLPIPSADDRFEGDVALYRYAIDGEDDLLHISVSLQSGGEISVDEGRRVLSFLLPQVPPGLVWLKPAQFSQHFYLGHELLVNNDA